MSGSTKLARVAILVGALIVLALGFALPSTSHASAPQPQATTASPSAAVSANASPTPSTSASPSDVDATDELDDDGTDPTPGQNNTWIAIAGAAGLSLLAGLVVVLRKR